MTNEIKKLKDGEQYLVVFDEGNGYHCGCCRRTYTVKNIATSWSEVIETLSSYDDIENINIYKITNGINFKTLKEVKNYARKGKSIGTCGHEVDIGTEAVYIKSEARDCSAAISFSTLCPMCIEEARKNKTLFDNEATAMAWLKKENKR